MRKFPPMFTPLSCGSPKMPPNCMRANIERLHAENPQGSVIIQADTNSKNGLLVQVMDAARLANVPNVSLAAEVVGE